MKSNLNLKQILSEKKINKIELRFIDFNILGK